MNPGRSMAERPRGGTYAVLASPADGVANLTGYRFRSRARAARALEGACQAHPEACLSYWPTAAERARWDAQRRAVEAFEVVYWRVCRDWGKGGSTVRGVPLSPMYAESDQAERALVQLRAHHAGAYLWEFREHFNPARPGDARERAELLARMAPLTS